MGGLECPDHGEKNQGRDQCDGIGKPGHEGTIKPPE
jgi:hypothetical protein